MYADKNFYLSGAPATTLTGSGTAQAITASAASTNVYDFGGTTTIGQADGKDALWVEILLPAALTGTVSVFTIALQDSADNSSFADLVVTKSFGQAELVTAATAQVGTFFRFAVPPSCRRYLRVYYTLTTGTITAGGFHAILKAYN